MTLVIALWCVAVLLAMACVAVAASRSALAHPFVYVVCAIVMGLIVLAVLVECSLRAFAFYRPLPILTQGDESVSRTIRTYRLKPGVVRYGFAVNSRGDGRVA